MAFLYTPHAVHKLKERHLSKSVVEKAVQNPDETLTGYDNRLIAHKLVKGRLLRIIYVTKANNYIIITAYYTEPERYKAKT